MSRRSTEPARGPGGAVVSRSALMLVRRVLHAYREGWVLDARLDAAARMIAGDARLHGVAAERMLVALKAAWAGLDDVAGLHPSDARALLDRLVTLSIRAYFAGRGGEGRTPTAA